MERENSDALNWTNGEAELSATVVVEKRDYGAVVRRDEAEESIMLTHDEIDKLGELVD